MATATISFNGTAYDSLVSLQAADAAAQVGDFAQAWAALETTEKERRLINTTVLVLSEQEFTTENLAGKRGVATAIVRLAMTQRAAEGSLTSLSAGSVSLNFRARSGTDNWDPLALRLLRTAAGGTGGDFGTSGFAETPQADLSSYAGQDG